MKEIYVKFISTQLQLQSWQVENCVQLLEDSCTIPFISRYRKERTGAMNDAEVAATKHYADIFSEMEKRKATILESIDEQGKLTDELRLRIENCVKSSELEDLYLPYRPKRKTRATVAAAKGLEPLADILWNGRSRSPEADARRFLNKEVPSVEDALAGARDIVAERLADSATVREGLRGIFRTRRIVSKATKAASDNPEASKYRSYFNFNQPLSKAPSHTVLALMRAQNEGFVRLSLDADATKCGNKIYYDYCQEKGYPGPAAAEQMHLAVDDAYTRLLEPSITTEILREAKERADVESVRIFGENLRQLLLAPPVGQKRVLAIDPGFRTGCKVVCLDEHGSLLCHDVIYPHPPVSKKIQAITLIAELVENYSIEVIAIGSGTAGRETEEFVRRVGLPDSIRIFSVTIITSSILIVQS